MDSGSSPSSSILVCICFMTLVKNEIRIPLSLITEFTILAPLSICIASSTSCSPDKRLSFPISLRYSLIGSSIVVSIFEEAWLLWSMPCSLKFEISMKRSPTESDSSSVPFHSLMPGSSLSSSERSSSSSSSSSSSFTSSELSSSSSSSSLLTRRTSSESSDDMKSSLSSSRSSSLSRSSSEKAPSAISSGLGISKLSSLSSL